MTEQDSQKFFDEIVNKFTGYPGVMAGKMMSSPGLKYNDKVFAFYHNHHMGFRLGPSFDAEKFGVVSAKPLSPFKTKPPLKGWLMIHVAEQTQWEPLAEIALEYTKKL